ncbi:MAG TPA: hypothetical protein EYQ25_02505 [Planctomycetes bacterium]|nr:hypothetical protein [Planctomycetota bacterium]HIL35854.1 hypothetical protein [Planctomycetota bacterium]
MNSWKRDPWGQAALGQAHGCLIAAALGVLLGWFLAPGERQGEVLPLGRSTQRALAEVDSRGCLEGPTAPIAGFARLARRVAGSPDLPGIQALLHADPEVTGAGVRLLLARGQRRAAAELLRASSRTEPESWAEVALAMGEAGQGDMALEFYIGALERDYWPDEALPLLCSLNPAGLLEFLDAEMGHVVDSDSWYGELLHEARAQALSALGRNAEAAGLLPPIEDYLQVSKGCVGPRLLGEDWEWRVWSEVDPKRVEAVLLAALEEGAYVGTSLVRLARIWSGTGSYARLRPLVEQTVQSMSAKQAGELHLAMAPYLGWDPVLHALEQDPDDEELAWAVGDHLRREGQESAAIEIWAGLMAEQTDLWLDSEVLSQTVVRAPRILLPILEQRLAGLEFDAEEPSKLSDALGSMAAIHWALGNQGRTVSLLEEAQRANPAEQYWSSRLRLIRLGCEPDL